MSEEVAPLWALARHVRTVTSCEIANGLSRTGSSLPLCDRTVASSPGVPGSASVSDRCPGTDYG